MTWLIGTTCSTILLCDGFHIIFVMSLFFHPGSCLFLICFFFPIFCYLIQFSYYFHQTRRSLLIIIFIKYPKHFCIIIIILCFRRGCAIPIAHSLEISCYLNVNPCPCLILSKFIRPTTAFFIIFAFHGNVNYFVLIFIFNLF